MAAHFNNASLATAGTPIWPEGDFNYDGKVNALDFNALKSSWTGAGTVTGFSF
jgi:hypothetical protein